MASAKRGRSAPPIRAAGGLVWRPAAREYDGVEVVVIRRDRYGDWSLPKGKLTPGEKHKEAALREVREETGIDCELGPKLGRFDFDTPIGPKRVKWWAMTPVAIVPGADVDGGRVDGGDIDGAEGTGAGSDVGVPCDPDEVSEVVWLPFEEAWERLTYATDRRVLSAFADRVLARTK